MGGSSNIYVSATRGYQPDEGRDDEGYRRSQHTWLISIEPHKHSIPLLPRNKHEPVHYFAVQSGDSYNVEAHPTEGIIGTILVAEGAHVDHEKVHQTLSEGLTSSHVSLPSEQAPDGESDRWIRKGLHILQRNDMTGAFDVGEFMTFAHGFMAQRIDGEAPAMIAYPGLHKDHPEKTQKHSFWLSTPMKQHKLADPGSKSYGGLM